MRASSRATGVLVALAAAGLALSACGIPTQPSASPISANQIRSTLPANHEATSPCSPACGNVTVFFVAPGDHVRPEARVVPLPPKVRTVVDALLAGPTESERVKTGIGTALGSGIRLRSAKETAKKKTVTLTFNADFGTLSGTKWVLGVAQVVYTVSSVTPGVAVTFEIAGAQTEVPLETGALSTGAVSESQYASLLTTHATTVTTP